MNIRILCQVECKGGFCGISVVATITNPPMRLLHLVISEHRQPETFHLVPFELVTDSSDGLIRLDCTWQRFKALPNFIEREYVRKQLAMSLHDSQESILQSVQEIFVGLPIPIGESSVSQQAQIQSNDGVLGHLAELQVEPLSGEITHVVVRQGERPDKKRVAIPVAYVERVERNIIYTKLTRQELEALPQTLNDSSILPA